jgi:hypothetical protein
LQDIARIEICSIILYIYRFLFRPGLAIFLVVGAIPRMLKKYVLAFERKQITER